MPTTVMTRAWTTVMTRRDSRARKARTRGWRWTRAGAKARDATRATRADGDGGDAPRADDGDGARGGGVFGGGDSGGGDGGRDGRGGGGRGGAGAGVVALGSLVFARRARAGERTHDQKMEKLGNAGTSVLYGFVGFYALKLALKRLFAPVALFAVSTQILWKMRALSVSPRMLYDAYVRPYLPREYQKNLEDFSVKALKTKAAENALRDGWWDKQERRFWACAHRILPACNSPLGERALIFGIILAGLA